MKKFFKNINLNAEITHGVCPNCEELTALISITKDLYRCVTCGFDLEQKVNGQISYIPAHQVERFIKSDVAQKGK
tara:strand:- start:96 stop:320 length:225 start_codon:yes stop_codon:yes gene_type:complete